MSIGDSPPRQATELSPTDNWGAKEAKRWRDRVEASVGEERGEAVGAGVKSETTV